SELHNKQNWKQTIPSLPQLVSHCLAFSLVTLTSFITHAHSVMAITAHTIKVYLSGISFFCKLITGSPSLASNHPQITALLKGLIRQEPAKIPRRLPLTSDLLLACIHTIRSGYCTYHIARTLEAMFLLAFFGFLRCSEFTSSTIHFDPRHHACISDLSQFSNDAMVFYIKQSKTNQSGHPTPVFYFNVPSPLNSFETLTSYLSFRKSQSTSSTDPLFVSEVGQVVTRFWFQHHLRHVLSLSGVSPLQYSGHSFRIGAATSASRNGVPEHLIKIMGRWSSQTYHRYIRSDLKDLRSAQTLLNK
ncbi:uncharacterized protein LOC125901913, partial [Epinephelus fuscoguttatus]|uniref:uncharacterized protein LOC125901913 n=1 Tax=Epinephelus fuscoguttatus TaxID=293821 RepID=UPI0020D0CC26